MRSKKTVILRRDTRFKPFFPRFFPICIDWESSAFLAVIEINSQSKLHIDCNDFIAFLSAHFDRHQHRNLTNFAACPNYRTLTVAYFDRHQHRYPIFFPHVQTMRFSWNLASISINIATPNSRRVFVCRLAQRMQCADCYCE